MPEPKIIRHSNFSKNVLGISVPHVQILGRKEENGEQKFFIHMEKNKEVSGWYSKSDAKNKLGLDL